MSNAPNSRIRIVAVPPGAAPLWFREKWVGLELPLWRNRSLTRTPGISVLVRPSFFSHLLAMLRGQYETIAGYRIEAKTAIEILEKSSPEAAAWWRQNTPKLLKPGRLFLFHVEACELVINQ